jgi:hypothetical protein
MPSTPARQPFNALEWIGTRAPSLQRFLGHGSQPLLHFALMWNMFEGQLCEASVSVAKLRKVAELLAQRNLASHPDAISFLQFVRGRYWDNNAVTYRFHALNLRSTQESNAVTAVLSGEATGAAEVIFAQLLVVYRYRNNTFHGLKEIAEVLGSQELFNEAARFLSAALERA